MAKRKIGFGLGEGLGAEERFFESPVLASPEIISIVDLLILLLSGKQVYKNDILKVLSPDNANMQAVLQEGQESNAVTLVSEIDRSRLTKTLFKTVEERSDKFLEVVNERGIIIYADPSAPGDASKQITYLWNAELKKWQVFPGDNANAIIPNERDGQLIEIKGGKAAIYGREEGAFAVANEAKVERANRAQSIDLTSAVLATQASMQEGLSDELKLPGADGNMLSVFEVEEHRKARLQELVTQFSTQMCDRTRGQLMSQMENSFRESSLSPLPFASPYEDGGYKYFWYEVNGSPVGLRVDRDKNIQVLLPEGYNGKELGVMLWKDWLEGTAADGRPHPKTGFSGGSVLFIDSSGNAKIYHSAKNPNSEHLVPEHPVLKETVRLSVADVSAHLERAREAGRIHAISHAAAFPEREDEVSARVSALPAAHEREQAVTATQEGRFMRGVLQQRSTEEFVPQVKTPSGINFELRCVFDEANCQYEGNGDYQTYPAKVYVFTYPGTGIKEMRGGNFTIPQGVIVEVSKEGEARVRVAYTPSGNESTIHSADIRFRGYVAKVTNIGAENPSVEFPEESMFRENGERGMFMCANGCSGHYSEANRSLMKTGAALEMSL